ncbi:MAG: anthranilate synthase component I [bacterium]
MIKPEFNEFSKLSPKFKLVPVYTEILADMETPISIFKKIADKQENSFLLESVEGGENVGRYSFIGINPFAILKKKNGNVTLSSQNKSIEKFDEADILKVLKSYMSPLNQAAMADMPPFLGGAVGYIGYDYIKVIEKIPDDVRDDLKLPESIFLFAENVIVFDHVKHKAFIVHNAPIHGDVKSFYFDACERIESIKALLGTKPDLDSKHDEVWEFESVSNFTESDYINAVEKSKEYIYNGDIFQVVISQRWGIKLKIDDFEIYRALRVTNPSPYMFYFKTQDITLVGASPEVLVKLTGNQVCVRPIAGTRRRGRDPEEDKALEKDLLSDEKECAEHVMLVDLGRNDIGRVCKKGSVHLSDKMVIEKYSHVMHIVSEVLGELDKNKDCFDVFRACFPAGTVSGAPKIRAMEIINELESDKRGPYSGSLGYFGFNGNMDTCIIIRTMVIKNNVAYIQAGAGIVADSVGEFEYKETKKKANALFQALRLAQDGLL